MWQQRHPAAVPVADSRCRPPCCCSHWPRTATPCPHSETWNTTGTFHTRATAADHAGRGVIVRHSPVIGDVEVKVADVRRVFRQNDVAGELSRGEPEGKVWHIIELEFSMNSAEGEHNDFYCSAKMCSLFSPLWQNDRKRIVVAY